MRLPTFKLPPNSLFAVLLRSRWWISLLIALLFVLAALAVLPMPYGPLAAMGSLPFWAIGVVALVRQWHQPSARQRDAALQRLHGLNASQFTSLLQRAFEADGYQVAPAGVTGADLRLTRDDAVTLVSLRRFKASSLGTEPLRELGRAMQASGAANGIAVSAGQVTAQAQQWAASQALRILDAEALVDWLYRMKQL